MPDRQDRTAGDVLQLRDVTQQYGHGPKAVRAVRGVSLTVAPGETVALVGESGCGKSSLGRVIAGLHEPSGGTVLLGDHDLGRNRSMADRRRVQMVFQHPGASLNPKLTIGAMLDEPLRLLLDLPQEQRVQRVESLLVLVGLDRSYARRRPAQLSGGQQQRVAIARALAANPAMVVLDEPTASLDQSVRARIIALLREVQSNSGCGYIFISHDLETVKRIADRVAVMYLGRIVEIGTTEMLFSRPAHPYTEALLSAVPKLARPDRRSRIVLAGETPSPTSLPDGCAFRTRCPLAHERCHLHAPQLLPFDGADDHQVECFARDTPTAAVVRSEHT